MKKSIIILFTVFLISPVIVTAQWSTNPMVNNVICNLTGDQAIPKVACCTNGDTYVSYFSSESGNYNVRLQRLDVYGNILWAANGILISNNPSMSWLTDWDMNVDPAGHCLIAVMDMRNGNNNIYGYRIAPDGTFDWGSNGVTLSNNMSFNASPKVISTASGNAIFAWQADSVIIMQKVSPTGTLVWGAFGKTFAPSGASSSHQYTWPQLMPVGSDEFLMKYYEDTGSGLYPTRHLYVQKFDGSGNTVWTTPAPVSLAGAITLWTQILSFISDYNDGCYITWHDDRDGDQRSNSWVQHVSSTGSITLGTNGTEVCNNNAYNHFYPQAAFPQGSMDVYVFWNEMNALQSQWGIFGQKVSATGTLGWGTTGNAFIPLSTTDVYPLAAKPYSTDVVAFYEQYADASNQLLKAMRITPSGSYVWTGNSVNISSVVSQKVHEEVTNLNNNQWILAWEDNRDGGDFNIYAQNLKPDGGLGPVGPLTYGNIDGHITLVGGSGNMTSVIVQAGTYNTHPDATGHYTLTNVLTGTYTVQASLTGYTSASVPNVVVVTNLTTSNVDLTLNYIPTTGFITGTVTLSGGTGNVMQTLVTAGSYSTTPDAAGFYSMEVTGGTYVVTATLTNYTQGVVTGVNVTNGQTTSGVNFTLYPTGSIQGQVTLNGGSGDVTQTIVAAGSYSTHPDASGFYGMIVQEGTYTVTATLSGYEPGSVSNVVVAGGQTVLGVNFVLNPIQSAGTIEGTVTLVGGMGTVTNAIVHAGSYMTNPDINGHYSLIVDAGTYEVYATLPLYASDTAYSVIVTVGQTTSAVDLTLTAILSVTGLPEAGVIKIVPNPAGPGGKLQFTIPSEGGYVLQLFDQNGRMLVNYPHHFNPGNYELLLSGFPLRAAGDYYFRITGNNKEMGCRFIYKR
jgi:hypothetical protein